MCDTCARGYFMDWANDHCAHCDEVGHSAPIIAPVAPQEILVLQDLQLQ